MRITPTLSALALLLIPLHAEATAGFAERSWEFEYNTYTTIEGHHSDLCSQKTGSANDCILTGNMLDKFFQDAPLLLSISVPPHPNSPHIFGQAFIEEDWLIYDLSTEKIVIRSENYSEVLSKWHSFGYDKPTHVHVRDLDEHFTETEKSRRAHRMFGYAKTPLSALILMWFSLFMLFQLIEHYSICIVSGYFGWKVWKKYIKERKAKHLFLCIGLTLLFVYYLLIGLTPILIPLLT